MRLPKNRVHRTKDGILKHSNIRSLEEEVKSAKMSERGNQRGSTHLYGVHEATLKSLCKNKILPEKKLVQFLAYNMHSIKLTIVSHKYNKYIL